MSPSVSDDALTAFRSGLDGAAFAPADEGWEAARQPWNLIADQRPGLVVEAASTADVAATIELAKSSGVRVSAQGTGHGSARMPGLEETILLRTATMNSVAVDPSARTATIGAGAKWGDVLGAAVPHGLTGLHGSSGTVGVAGYVLAGGLGWLARSEGFTCNHALSFELVTAEGEVKTVSRDSEPELFWALRGGAAAPVVLTSIECELVELQTAYAGALMWPMEQATEVAQGWREWTETIPDELTSTIKLLRFPPLPEIPEPIRGRNLVAITLTYRGGEDEGAELVAPLRAIAEPYMDMLGTVPAPALAEIAGDPQDPVSGRGDGFLLSSFDEAAVDAYVEVAGAEADAPLIFLEVRHLGGALDRSSPDHGALDVAGGSHLVYGIGMSMSPEMDAAVSASLAGISERLSPWRADCNLFGFAELQSGFAGSFPAATAKRLERVRSDYDPDGLISGIWS